jgi:hypothetical protein
LWFNAMTKLLLISLIFLVACSKPPVEDRNAMKIRLGREAAKLGFPICDPDGATWGVPDTQACSALRREAAKRRLRWNIVCGGGDSDGGRPPASEACFGYAQSGSSPDAAFYIEQGAKPFWGVSAASDEEAAIKLLRTIQGPPNMFPPHGPPDMFPKRKP